MSLGHFSAQVLTRTCFESLLLMTWKYWEGRVRQDAQLLVQRLQYGRRLCPGKPEARFVRIGTKVEAEETGFPRTMGGTARHVW